MNKIKLFENYLNGKLKGIELSAFLDSLTNDQEFEREFKLYSDFMNFIKSKARRKLFMSTLNKVAKEYFSNNQIMFTKKIKHLEKCNYNIVYNFSKHYKIIISSVFIENHGNDKTYNK